MSNHFSRAGRRLAVLVATAVAAGTALVGIGLGSPSQATAPTAAPVAASAADGATADWTMMIYAVLDTNNIANHFTDNLARLTQVADSENVNIVALVDLPEQDDKSYPTVTLPGIAPFSTAKLMVLDGGRWNEIRDLGEISLGRPDALARFIEEAADGFPADKYGLMLVDHGASWRGGYYDIGEPGTSHLSVADMRNGMLEGMQAAGIDRFEVVDHEACLMANYETSSALAPLTKWQVASEEVTFGGTIQPTALTALANGATGRDFGVRSIEDYAAFADQLGDNAGTFSALSVVDSDRVDLLDTALESFAQSAVAHMDEIAAEVGRARSEALEFSVELTDYSDDIVDLGDFLRHLSDVPADVAVARDAALTALDGSVTDLVTRAATSQASGMNVFFPDDPSTGTYVDQQIGPPGWTAFVEAYGDYTATIGAAQGQAVFTSDDAQILEQGPTGIKVAGQLGEGQADNVTHSETLLFGPLGGVPNALIASFPAYVNAGGEGQVQGVWSYGVTTIDNGQVQVPMTAVFKGQAGGLIGSAKALYTSPAGATTDVSLRFLLTSDGQIDGVTVSDAASGQGAGSIPLELGGTLTPVIATFDSSGYHDTLAPQAVRVNKQLALTYPQAAAGTPFEMDLYIEDVSGGWDVAFVQTQVVR